MLITILICVLIVIIGLLIFTLLRPPVKRKDYDDCYQDQSTLVNMEMYALDLMKKPPLL